MNTQQIEISELVRQKIIASIGSGITECPFPPGSRAAIDWNFASEPARQIRPATNPVPAQILAMHSRLSDKAKRLHVAQLAALLRLDAGAA